MKRKITKLMAAIALLVFMAPSMVGWGQTYTLVSQLSGLTEGTYCIAALNDGKYYTVPNTTINGQTFSCAEATYENGTLTPANGHGQFILTAVSGINNAYYLYNTDLQKYLVATGSKKFGYVDNTSSDYGYWTFSTVSSGGFSGAFSVQHSSKTQYMRAYNNSVRCYDGQSNNGVYLFSQNSGPSISAGNVNIAYSDTEGAIAYTINNPVSGGVLTASAAGYSWFTVGTIGSESVSFTCEANDGAERMATVTLTYTYNTDQTVTKSVTVTQAANPNAPGSQNNPYTVAQARAAIDAGVGVTGVYATGIVSAIPYAYTTNNGITFNMVDNTGDTDFLQAFKCTGTEAPNVLIGDVVVVSGNLIKYNSTYEFAQGCTVVSLTHPVPAVEDPVISPVEGIYTEAQNVTITCATDDATIYYTLDGSIPTNTSTQYNGAIIVSETTTIKAIAYKGEDHSNVVTAVYNIVTPLATMDEIMTAATSAGATATDAVITFNNWIVSGVGTNAKRAFVTDGTKGFIIYNSNGGLTFTRGDVLSGTKSCQVQLLNGAPCVKGLNASDFTITQTSQEPTITTTTIDALEAVNTGAVVNLGKLTYDGSKFVDANSNAIYYYNTIYSGNTLVANKEYLVKGVYVYYNGNASPNEIAPRDANDITEEVVPSITITPATVNLDAGEHYMNLLDLAYENIEVEGPSSFTVHYYNAQGDEIELVQGEAWLVAGVVKEGDVYQVLFAVVANYGEARTAYFKVSCGETYSNLVTVTQAAPVLDYAVLPFVWEGGSSTDFAALNGVTLSGNGSDYNSNQTPYLIKLDGTGDYIQVKTDGQPGTVTIGVKMIGGSNTSTITVQGSADGETFTDIEELTISGAQNDIMTLETTNAFDANDRYVRMLFTKGSNVGVGPITIAKGTAPSINIAPANFDLEAVGDLNGMQVASGFVTYNNIDITQASDFHFQFYNAEGEEQEKPAWILAAQVSLVANSYQAACMVAANNGVARSAYYKVYALGADSNPVYSNLVTINQAAPNYATLPFEFNGGKNDIDNTIGLTYEGLGSDYNATFNPTTKLKFDSTDDCLILKLNEAPTSLSYDIKGNSFDGSTFTVQTSADGETYSVLATYGNAQLASGSLTSITHLDLASDVRYIKWIYTNKSAGNVGLGNIHASVDYDIYGNVTVANLTIPANKTCTIYNGAVLNVTGTLTNEATENAWEHLVIKDGAQLKTPNEVKGTVEKNITGYGTTGKDNYVLLASPATIDACNSTGMWNHGQHADVDFYYFDQSREGEEWRNFKYGNTIFTGPYCMQQGQGFLYANKNDNTLTLQTRGYVAPNVDYQEHPFAPTNTPISVGVSYTAGKLFSGFNLVGNPFTCTAYLADGRDFYRMNANGNAIVLAEDNAINVCEGVFVVTTAAENIVTFTTEVPATAVNGGNIDLSLTQNHGALIDNARIRFGEGAAMPKMVFGGNSRIYFAQGNQDYAVVRSNAQGEMPVNFKAENNGTYTLSIDSKNVEMNYLHLIDNLTGADVDLLQTPSYSFEARTSDYASRFRLVFSANSNVEDNSEASFVYYNGSEWVLNNMGNATLQVIDITGRVLSSETISGNASISLNQTPGVYMLRLINSENVKTQKVVVR